MEKIIQDDLQLREWKITKERNYFTQIDIPMSILESLSTTQNILYHVKYKWTGKQMLNVVQQSLFGQKEKLQPI